MQINLEVKPHDIVLDMMEPTRIFSGKATPGNQEQIVTLLREAGYRMDQITDHLPHLMFHLGQPDDVL